MARAGTPRDRQPGRLHEVPDRCGARPHIPARAAHPRPVRQPGRRGRLPPGVPRDHRRRGASWRAHRGMGRPEAGCRGGPGGVVHAVRPGRAGPRLPDVHVARRGPGPATRPRSGPGLVAGSAQSLLRPAADRSGQQVGADVRYGDDGEAGRLRRPRQHHARGPGRLRPRRPSSSADRSQVVLLGPAVGCLPGSGPGGGRADLLPRTACAGRRHA